MAGVQAIEFVQMQQDDELWDLLISLALADASLTGVYLPEAHKHEALLTK